MVYFPKAWRNHVITNTVSIQANAVLTLSVIIIRVISAHWPVLFSCGVDFTGSRWLSTAVGHTTRFHLILVWPHSFLSFLDITDATLAFYIFCILIFFEILTLLTKNARRNVLLSAMLTSCCVSYSLRFVCHFRQTGPMTTISRTQIINVS